jgi:hypothetical protein
MALPPVVLANLHGKIDQRHQHSQRPQKLTNSPKLKDGHAVILYVVSVMLARNADARLCGQPVIGR